MNGCAAAVTRKLATMLAAGATPTHALSSLTEEPGEEGELAQRVWERIQTGQSPAAALAAEPAPQWRLIAAAWHIATRSGAPISSTLERMSEALTRLEELNRRREVVLAGPKGTVLLIASLPPISFIVGELLGIDVLSQLTTPAGILLTLTGGALLIAGIFWGLAMIRSVHDRDEIAGFELDLLWIALAGGTTPQQARKVVVHTADMFAAEWVDLESFREGQTAARVISYAHDQGIPVRDLVTHESHTLREHSHQLLEKDAERLAIRVLIPLGICILPSFMVVGVIPMMMALMG